MAVTNFIPEIWSASVLSALKTNLVAQGIANQNYSGDAKGNAVNITSITDPSIGDYTTHTDITIEQVTDATRQLLIDQQKYFAFEMDDVEAAQSVSGGALMAEATQRAAYGIAKEIDTHLLGVMAANVSAAAPDHVVEEATISTASDAYDALVDWSVLLDEADVPEQGRFAVVTPAFHGLLLKDQRFIAAGDEKGAAVRANGVVGTAGGFTIHKSNNLPDGPGAGAGKSMLAGYRDATTYVVQVNKVEAHRLEKRFADAVKGLAVYGSKVIRPTGLVTADIIVG